MQNDNTKSAQTTGHYQKLGSAMKTVDSAVAQFEKEEQVSPCIAYVGSFTKWVDSLDGGDNMTTFSQEAQDNRENISNLEVTINKDCSLTTVTSNGNTLLSPETGVGGTPQPVGFSEVALDGEVQWKVDVTDTWLSSFATIGGGGKYYILVTYSPSADANSRFGADTQFSGDKTKPYDWFELGGSGGFTPVYWKQSGE